MSFDLARGLRELSNEPTVPDEAVPLLTVRSRVRRARAVRTASVGAVSAAAAGALAVAVQAAPFRDAPTMPAGPTGVVEPTPAPTTSAPEPTPAPSAPVAEPPAPADPAAGDRPLVALTSDGRLVVLDPDTGAVRDEVTTGLGDTVHDGSVTVTPDGETAYVVAQTTDGGSSIHRVSLADGDREVVVADGWDPALSPDGGTLAYLGPRPGTERLTTMGLNLLDLATGTVRHLPDEEWCLCERLVSEPTWSPDGRRIALGLGWADRATGLQVTVVDLATAQTLGDARVLPTRQEPEGSERRTSVEDQAYLPDGRLAVLLLTVFTGENTSGESTDSVSVDVVDAATGDVTATVQGPVADRGRLSAVGGGLALVTEHYSFGGSQPRPQRVHLWDGTDGTEFRQVGEGIVAIGG